MIRFPLVILDCDGTLVDSLSSIWRCMHLAFGELGVGEVSRQAVSGIVGLSLERAISNLLPAADEALVLRLVDAYKGHYRRLADQGALASPLFPGVQETLRRLSGEGVLLGMATGKSMAGLKRTLREHGLEDLFSLLKSADCAPSKPHPGMVTGILEESGMDPKQVLMVGDTLYDIHMGQGAGVRTCAVTYGYHDRALLQTAAPDFWIDRFEQLGDLVRGA